MASRIMKGSAAGAAVIALVAAFEGYSSKAYPDVIGVWTICQGLTKGVKPGMTLTRSECDVKFLQALQEHEAGMRACLRDPDSIPIKPYIADVSLTYNIGVGNFCKSTVARKTNAKDYEGACNAMLAFNKAGGRVVKGLSDRRAKERKFCLEGL